MIITIRENLAAQLKCPSCHDAVSRSADSTCEKCHAYWHSDCAEFCPTCFPPAALKQYLEEELGDTIEVGDAEYAFLRNSDRLFPLEYSAEATREFVETGSWDLLAYSLSPIDILSSYNPADLFDLYRVEAVLGLDIIQADVVLADRLCDGLEIEGTGDYVRVEDGQCTWWGLREDWDDAVSMACFRLAKAVVQDFAVNNDYRYSTHTDDVLSSWYEHACSSVKALAGYGCIPAFVSPDCKPELFETVLDYLQDNMPYRMLEAMRKFLKSKRGQPGWSYIRSRMAEYLRS